MAEATRERDAAEAAFEAAAQVLAEAGFETAIGDAPVDGDLNRCRFALIVNLTPSDEEDRSVFAIRTLYEVAQAVRQTGCVDIRLGSHACDGSKSLILTAVVAEMLS